MKQNLLAIASMLTLLQIGGADAQSSAAPGNGASGSDDAAARIEACAKLLPTGSPKIKANYRLDMNPDATVRAATLLDSDKLGGPPYQAAAECMRKAFTQGGSFDLPKEKYEDWKTLTVGVEIAPQKTP